MQVWAVIYKPAAFPEDVSSIHSIQRFTLFIQHQLYQRGILFVDPESKSRIQKFYRREDACRKHLTSWSVKISKPYTLSGTLISRLLPRMLLKKRGLSFNDMTFAYTEAGKPYIASSLFHYSDWT